MHALASGPLLLYVITVHSNLVPNIKSKISASERYFVELALHLAVIGGLASPVWNAMVLDVVALRKRQNGIRCCAIYST